LISRITIQIRNYYEKKNKNLKENKKEENFDGKNKKKNIF
jgi:hypothetical protein